MSIALTWQDYEIRFEELHFGESLGNGAYGTVYKGESARAFKYSMLEYITVFEILYRVCTVRVFDTLENVYV